MLEDHPCDVWSDSLRRKILPDIYYLSNNSLSDYNDCIGYRRFHFKILNCSFKSSNLTGFFFKDYLVHNCTVNSKNTSPSGSPVQDVINSRHGIPIIPISPENRPVDILFVVLINDFMRSQTSRQDLGILLKMFYHGNCNCKTFILFNTKKVELKRKMKKKLTE